ncbi:esterase/lipase family protein [Thermodesulfobacteriota bacterium B35]
MLNLVRYIVRPSNLHFLTHRDSDTLIVFIHGIFSSSENAFKLYNKDGFFWDLLKDQYHFTNIDFAKFSYGRWDLSYLLSLDNPKNNLKKISEELYYQIRCYTNVILIGHSQGGLLSKVYALLFSNVQSIMIITLHTPHKDRSLYVMRSNLQKEWSEKSYQIPHIFAASVCDNKIVKPITALSSCTDLSYVSRRNKYKKLGHSHLSTCPDYRLLKLIRGEIIYFTNSGFNKKSISQQITKLNSLPSIKYITIIYSSSYQRITDAYNINLHTKDLLITNIWGGILYNSNKETKYLYKKLLDGKKTNIKFYINARSATFITRHILNLPDNSIFRLSSIDLDRHSKDKISIANDNLCEYVFALKSFNQVNPYKYTTFDVYDFNKKYLIDHYDFISLFSKLLCNRRLTM